jgi:hypothetical protein
MGLFDNLVNRECDNEQDQVLDDRFRRRGEHRGGAECGESHR